MSNPARKDLHDLVDALPPGEEQAARRYLEYLRDASDPFASLDGVDPIAALPAEERARLHASLREAEAEIAAGQAVPADVFLRELRAGK